MRYRLHLRNDSYVLEHVESVRLISWDESNCWGSVEVKCFGNDPVTHHRIVDLTVLAMMDNPIGQYRYGK